MYLAVCSRVISLDSHFIIISSLLDNIEGRIIKYGLIRGGYVDFPVE